MNNSTKALLSGAVLADFLPRNNKFYIFANAGIAGAWESDVYVNHTIGLYYNQEHNMIITGTVTYRIERAAAGYTHEEFSEYLNSVKTKSWERCAPEKFAEYTKSPQFQVLDEEIMKRISERKGGKRE